MALSTEHGANAVGDAPSLEERAAALRTIVQTPSERELAVRELAEVEAQLAANRSAELRAKAARRLLAIRRKMEALASETEQNDQRLAEAAEAYAAAMGELNATFDRTELLRLESEALAESFKFEHVSPPVATTPYLRPAVIQAQRLTAGVTIRHHRMIAARDHRSSRRTHEEFAGSEGHALLQQAGKANG